MSYVRHACIAAAVVAFGAALAGIASRATDNTSGVELFVSNSGTERCLCVAVADTEAERKLGLTPDGEPAPHAALVFAWPEPVLASFWMKDTRGPLDVGFVDMAGRVTAITTMPACTTTCPPYQAPQPTQLAIEAPSLSRLGIVVGSVVRIGSGCEV